MGEHATNRLTCPSPGLAHKFQWAWSTGWVAGKAAADEKDARPEV